MALVPGKRENDNDEFVGDASFDGTQVKRGFRGADSGAIRNTPFSDFGNQPKRGGGDAGLQVHRGSGFGKARTGGRVRSSQPRRPSAPNKQQERRTIASPLRQRQAGENLVSAPNKNELPGGSRERDREGDVNALLQSPIAGLTQGAVTQQDARFKSVTDPGTGITVPDQGDDATKAAFKRFFDTSFRPGINSQTPSQRDRNADPTRAAFQNRFFRSETLKDLGIG